MASNLEQINNHWNHLAVEIEQDFADVAYLFYQLFSKRYPEFPLPNSLGFSEVASYLDPRKKGCLEHGQGEKIDDSEFQNLIFDTAQKLGFVKKEVAEPRNELEKKLEIYSDPMEYEGAVEAVVVTGGAGQTIIKRLHHGLESIRLNRVETNKIFMLTGYRNVASRENDLLRQNGFTTGETEFELAKGAIFDLIPGGLDDLKEGRQKVVLGEDTYEMGLISGNCSIEGKTINITVLDCPFDKKRVLEDGTLATRALTEETFACLAQLLGDFDNTKTLYLVSHDIYQPAQMLFAQEVLGKRIGRNIVGSGPVNTDRIKINQSGEMELSGHGAVLSEINKYFNVICRFYNALKEEINTQVELPA